MQTSVSPLAVASNLTNSDTQPKVSIYFFSYPQSVVMDAEHGSPILGCSSEVVPLNQTLNSLLNYSSIGIESIP